MKTCGFHFDTTYTKLPEQFFTKLAPELAPKPDLVIVNDSLATSMGLSFSDLTEKEKADLFSGTHLPAGSTPFSQAYAGHQFGHFTMLGDGRAHILGEHITPKEQRFDIQFKGSGRTPYSRRGDGKAVLGPMLREYIISEAMYHLGIPTTRSLAVVTTGEEVLRETYVPGAILTRVASSHIRIGTFEFAAYDQDKTVIEALMKYTIQRHYSDILDTQNKPLGLIQAIMKKQIDLVVHWMRVGFIHGVMNTDNIALSGETIDYGPCAFMDTYDPKTVFSSIDHRERYCYGNQPKIMQWNLARFAEALLPLIDADENKAIKQANHVVNQFSDLYQRKWLVMMRSKLGLFDSQQGDEQLISDLLDWIHINHVDYTNTFRDLTQINKPTGDLYEKKPFQEWYTQWQARLKKNSKPFKSSLCLMRKNNPVVIPRNHKVNQALEAAHSGDMIPFNRLLKVLENPYRDDPSLTPYQMPPEPNERVYQTFCGT